MNCAADTDIQIVYKLLVFVAKQDETIIQLIKTGLFDFFTFHFCLFLTYVFPGLPTYSS